MALGEAVEEVLAGEGNSVRARGRRPGGETFRRRRDESRHRLDFGPEDDARKASVRENTGDDRGRFLHAAFARASLLLVSEELLQDFFGTGVGAAAARASASLVGAGAIAVPAAGGRADAAHGETGGDQDRYCHANRR